MAWFKKRSADAAELEALKAEISSMASRLDAADADKSNLQKRVESLHTDLNDERSAKAELESKVADVAGKIESSADSDELARLRDEVGQIGARLDAPIEEPPNGPPMADGHSIDELRDEMKAIRERIDGLDERVTSIATELANQLSELSDEIENVETPDAVQERALVQIRDAQQRLANEQARYQIAFRRDLAGIADRLREAAQQDDD